MDDAQNKILKSIEPIVHDTEMFIKDLLNGNEEGTNEFFEELFHALFYERNEFAFSDRIVVNRFLAVFERVYSASDAKGKEIIRHIFLNSTSCKAYFGDNLLAFVDDHLPSD